MLYDLISMDNSENRTYQDETWMDGCLRAEVVIQAIYVMKELTGVIKIFHHVFKAMIAKSSALIKIIKLYKGLITYKYGYFCKAVRYDTWKITIWTWPALICYRNQMSKFLGLWVRQQVGLQIGQVWKGQKVCFLCRLWSWLQDSIITQIIAIHIILVNIILSIILTPK